MDSNHRPSAYEADNLPLIYRALKLAVRMGFEPIYVLRDRQASTPSRLTNLCLVRIVGFEPTTTQFQTVDSTRLSYILMFWYTVGESNSSCKDENLESLPIDERCICKVQGLAVLSLSKRIRFLLSDSMEVSCSTRLLLD